MTKKPYTAPALNLVGTLGELTLAGNNKYTTTHPDGIVFHPTPTTSIPLSS